jgi:hypothetical protein
MQTSDSLHFEIVVRSVLPPTSSATVSFYLKTTEDIRFVSVPAGDDTQPHRITGDIKIRKPETRLLEIGAHLKGLPGSGIGETIRLLEVLKICIMPESASQASQLSTSIENIRFAYHGEEQNKHARLCWEYRVAEDAERKTEGIPYSEITGPFSHFLVRFNGFNVGRVYALEHPISEEVAGRITEEEVDVEVTGIGFDGRELAKNSVKLHQRSPHPHHSLSTHKDSTARQPRHLQQSPERYEHRDTGSW